jgi:hypothetical protein
MSDIETLTSFDQLPREGDQVFVVGNEQVRFTVDTSREVHGWAVTKADPLYTGFLSTRSSTVLHGQTGATVPVHTYTFKYEGKPRMAPSPQEVTFEEFVRFYFGA